MMYHTNNVGLLRSCRPYHIWEDNTNAFTVKCCKTILQRPLELYCEGSVYKDKHCCSEGQQVLLMKKYVILAKAEFI